MDVSNIFKSPTSHLFNSLNSPTLESPSTLQFTSLSGKKRPAAEISNSDSVFHTAQRTNELPIQDIIKSPAYYFFDIVLNSPFDSTSPSSIQFLSNSYKMQKMTNLDPEDLIIDEEEEGDNRVTALPSEKLHTLNTPLIKDMKYLYFKDKSHSIQTIEMLKNDKILNCTWCNPSEKILFTLSGSFNFETNQEFSINKLLTQELSKKFNALDLISNKKHLLNDIASDFKIVPYFCGEYSNYHKYEFSISFKFDSTKLEGEYNELNIYFENVLLYESMIIINSNSVNEGL